jgi:tetratricopeptide (TPR) repeat protein
MPFSCVIGGQRADRVVTARQVAALAGGPVVPAVPAAQWPFTRTILPSLPSDSPALVFIEDLHLAFPIGQKPGTRLVLTQSTYQLQRWIDWLEQHPHVSVVAHASRAALAQGAPESAARRGPWQRIGVMDLEGDEDPSSAAADSDQTGAGSEADGGVSVLRRAFGLRPEGRLDVVRAAVQREPANPALQLLLASVFMELDDLQPAQDALEAATAHAPDWEAVWFEYGKLWLRADDLERAAEKFAEAARLMPAFSAALSNLGASLAETDRPEEAIAALEQALRHDPSAHQTLNNLAVVYREQGRLDEAIEGGRRVVRLAPDFVFGRYNLAHALFLSGRFSEARDTYAEAHDRDRQKNPVQAARLAVSRAAAGEGEQAIRDMNAVLARVPETLLSTIVGEAEETLGALLDVPGVPREAVTALLEAVRKGRT